MAPPKGLPVRCKGSSSGSLSPSPPSPSSSAALIEKYVVKSGGQRCVHSGSGGVGGGAMRGRRGVFLVPRALGRGTNVTY